MIAESFLRGLYPQMGMAKCEAGNAGTNFPLLKFWRPFLLPGFAFVFLLVLPGCITKKAISEPQTWGVDQNQVASNRLANVVVNDWVVLKTEDLEPSPEIMRDWRPLWSAPTNVVVDALEKLPAYLRTKRNALWKLNNLKTSNCQAFGITYTSKRCILMNFGPSGYDHFGWADEGYRKWYLWCYDCGPTHWRVIYSPNDQTFKDLRYQGGY